MWHVGYGVADPMEFRALGQSDSQGIGLPVTGTPVSIAGGMVEVILVRLGAELSAAGELAQCLSYEERLRASRFYFERDRHRFIVVRARLRHLLASRLGMRPDAVELVYGPRGKPELSRSLADADLCFNVSHSEDVAVYAFSSAREIGVDVEVVRELRDADEIAARFFSRRENEAYLALDPRDRPLGFFNCWTRKEAFIKAVGDGLSHPLDAFDVTLAPGEPARLLRVAGDHEAPGRFLLQGLEPAEGFAAALAVLGRPTRVACFCWDQSLEEMNGPRRERRQDDLQGGREPRRAVLDLAD